MKTILSTSSVILAVYTMSAAVVTYDSSSTSVLDDGIPAGTVVEKVGNGEITANTVFRGSVFVEEGTLAVHPQRFAFKQYRFKIDAIEGSADKSDGMEIGEFKLLRDGENVTAGFISVSNCPISEGGGGNPDAEGPENAVDGKDWTKFLDKSFGKSQTVSSVDKCYLQLVYSTPVEITGYNWASCDYFYSGSSSRLPKNWRLQGSNDGITWIDLDVQTNFSPIHTAKTWQSTDGFMISSCDAEGQVVSVAKDANLTVSSAYKLGSLYNKGTVSLGKESNLMLDSIGAIAVVGGGIIGEGGLIKNGTGDLYLQGENNYSGTTKVNSGHLIVGRNGSIAAKWFRVTFKQNYHATPALIDLAEWAFFDADGNRVGINLTKMEDGTPARELLPGTCCMEQPYSIGSNNETVDKLFDNNLNTKICMTDIALLPTDAQTWRTLIVRLPNDTAAVASYNFTVAGDNSSGTYRSPNRWLLEASFDGENWFEVDNMISPVMPTAPKTAYNGGNAMPLRANVCDNEYASKWFKVTFKSTYSYSSTYLIGLSEWYLYDVNGNRCGMNLTELSAGTAPKDMAPGTCCLADSTYSIGSVNEGPSKMFDDNDRTKLCLTQLQMSSDPASWRTVVVRLRDSDPAIVKHLFRVGDNSNGKDRSPNKWVVETSYDGINWTVVETRDSVVYPTATYELYNDGEPYDFIAGTTDPKGMGSTLSPKSSLDVAADAEVIVLDESQVGALTVDMNGSGIVRGFRPAVNGTLSLVNYVKGDNLIVALPITLSNTANLDNLKSWLVNVNGVAKPKIKFFFEDGVPYIKLPQEFCIFFR